MTFASTPIGRIPRFHGSASVIALGSLIGVPLIAAFFPRWANRVAMPLLAVTSAGVFLTVPDTERIGPVMLLVAIAAVLCFGGKVDLHQGAIALTAFAIMATAVLDSGGRGAALARAVGCFGVLLAAPVAAWLSEVSTKHSDERRPPLVVLLLLHCLVVGWSSRALIRETAPDRVLPAAGSALLIAAVLLFATARSVSVEP